MLLLILWLPEISLDFSTSLKIYPRQDWCDGIKAVGNWRIAHKGWVVFGT